MAKPLLSIGIIFKNEIRCLERCLKSFQPLRELIPCEVVMADTGSTDGSREIAGKYADILFDFPWINDFAAARNAVMDRCSGGWYFSVDADEWLGGDVDELAAFVQPDNPFEGYSAAVNIRNYRTADLSDNYGEFIAVRLVRMSAGLRFSGAIHETWRFTGKRIVAYRFTRIFLHHDGYVDFDSTAGKPKRERNLALLRKELEKDPDNLLRLLQWIESGSGDPDYLNYLRRAMKLVREKQSDWSELGGAIFRYAVSAATTWELPELDEWIDEAERLFPDSLYVRIDVEYSHFARVWDTGDYAKCIMIGEPCLQTMIDLRKGRISRTDLLCGTLIRQGRNSEQELIIFLAEAYRREKQYEKCIEYLGRVEYEYLNETQVRRLTRVVIGLHTQSNVDTAPLVAEIWDSIQEPLPNKGQAQVRRAAFLQEASTEFQNDRDDGERPAYMLFLPLVDRCEIGRAAQLLELTDAAALEAVLGQVERWNELPVTALEHAILRGARFPLPDKPLKIEEIDALAARMARAGSPLSSLVILASNGQLSNWQSLSWARGLALAAVRSCQWAGDGQEMELSRAFAKIENKFLSQYYATDLLCSENIHVLPPLHRFGWYCARAYAALDGGNPAGYVRLLREGLLACEAMKPMVEFLAEHIPELQAPPPSPELLRLAEQVRTLLSAYAADDPAVAMLKATPAYQKVAHMLE